MDAHTAFSGGGTSRSFGGGNFGLLQAQEISSIVFVW